MTTHWLSRLLGLTTSCLALLATLWPGDVRGQTQFQGWCSEVEIKIVQELALERIGFEATLTVTNNDGADAITDFSAALTFEDPSITDPEEDPDASSLFFVRQPTVQNVNAIDGTGVIAPTKTAIVKWFIIPTIGAGGSEPQGKQYRVGCNLGGKLVGVEIPADNMFAIPDTITVKPEPQLRITYFQPRDARGDDPFTPEVESPIPFTLGVLVHNHGFGPARNLRINSQQPKIVENQNGLLLVARLLGTRVNDSVLDESSLKVEFGDVLPTETVKGAWDMITSLNGTFIEFKASYTHAPELGGEATSVITDLDAHFIAAEVLNDDPGRDTIKDFLADVDRDANEIPDALYETDEGNILPVNHQTMATTSGGLAGNDFEVEINSSFENWIYVRVADPGQNKVEISRVERSDGKVLNPCNYWTHTKYAESDNTRFDWLNIFDKVANNTNYTYSVTYNPGAVDSTPPETTIRFAGENSDVGGTFYLTRDTQIYFTSEDDSPVSIEYKIDGGTYAPALPFTIPTPGTYVVTYRATDSSGNVEAEKSAQVAIAGTQGPVVANAGVNVGNLFLPGSPNVVSVRPDMSEVEFGIGASPVQVDGTIDIFRGVVVWPRVSGIPPSPTPQGDAILNVSGNNVDFYRYRVNGGAWNPEMAVATPISLSGLSGAVGVEIVGRSQHGGYPDDADALAVGWTVDPSAPMLTQTGLPATPSAVDADVTVSFGGVPELTDYRWNLDDTFFRAEQPIGTPLMLSALDPGDHELAIIGTRSGVWQDTMTPTTVQWRYDPGYGYDFSALTRVKSTSHPDIAGQTLTNVWDGTNDGGVPQLPGAYTVRLKLTDALGRTRYRSEIVFIENLSAGETEIASGGASFPHAKGDWVVWQQQSEGVGSIRARNLPGGSEIEVANSAFAEEKPRTDGRYVVWQARQANGVYDLLYADLTQQPLTPLKVINSPGVNEINADLDWPWVVYEFKPTADEAVPWQIGAKNLVSGQVLHVDPSTQDQLSPSVHAGRVVWQDWRDVGPGEIYFEDLETGDNRRITQQTAGQYNPVIHDHTIVWQDNRDVQLDLYRYDLRKGVEERLTHTSHNEVSPRLCGKWLTFLEDSLGATAENIRLMDLDSMESVPVTQADSIHSPGSLGDGYAVWGMGPVGNQRLLASFLPSLQPVMQNHNMVVLTSDLVSRYGSAHGLLTAWNASANVTGISRYQTLAVPPVVETATWNGGAPGGTDFALVAGDFLWIEFDQARLLELGTASASPVDLSAGNNVLSYTGFPIGYTAFDFLDAVGDANVNAIRMLDPLAGVWRSIEVSSGTRVGSNFAIPRVSALLVNLKNPVVGWTP